MATTARGRTTRAGGGRRGAQPRLRKADRTLVIIGGHEDKEGDRAILREVAERAGSGALVVATVASEVPDELWNDYAPLFRKLGVRDVRRLDVRSREDAVREANTRVFDGATAVFFTGGDQLKITSQIGDTPVFRCIRELFDRGGTICGTSAGASVMSGTMLVSGPGDESNKIGGSLRMAPGIGLLEDVIVDQHFAERGRIGRLIAAVAQNPRLLGVGIDENTAVVVRRGRFRVLGAGAVYVVDGRGTTYTNLTAEAQDRTLAVFDVKLHVLSDGDVYNLGRRRPQRTSAESALRVAEAEEGAVAG